MTSQRISSKIAQAPGIALSVDLQHDDPVLVVTISGELDMAAAVVLEEAIRPYQGLHESINYDLAGLTFIDCAGLRALLAPADGDPFSERTSMTSVSRCVRRLLELLQLESIIAS